MTNELVAETTIHAPRADVFAVLRDVEGYERYTDYVTRVARDGDGGPGTEYAVTLSWWRLSYVARFRVTGIDPPERIEWELTKDLDARAAWRLEPVEVDDPDVEDATRLTVTARYDPDTADHGALSLPRLVPMSAVVARARPFVEREAERVLARVVADIEGAPRRARLDVRIRRDVDRDPGGR